MAAWVAALVTMQGAPASAAPPAVPSHGGDCIETVGQPDWVPVDDHTLLVTSGLHRFKVETDTCPPLHRAFPTVVTELLGGGSICTPTDVRLHVSAGGDAASIYCSIRSITPITADEARRLGSRRR